MGTYLAAATVEAAVAAMADGARPVAGGTDLVVAARQGKTPLPVSLVGIHRIPGLDSIAETEDGLEIGTLVSHASVVDNPKIRTHFTALADASALVGSHATRAQGTIGGNVMNASPAMDTGAPLLCFGATAVLASAAGERSINLVELWTGPGSTSADPRELLVSIKVPAPPANTGSAYVRLQYRRQMEIAVVGAAAVVSLEDDLITSAAIAITALAPVIHRVPAAEEALVGTSGDEESVAGASDAAAQAARPIDDVRASATYRKAMAAVVTKRAIAAAIARAHGDDVAIPASETTFGS
ncbi:MAG: xanthine dehydrogenase family protein subunit M [Acidimicrobiia bacterium]|nr:xanthine dehydrogenase family protein subunit M [Acidimicrobiia bacterium]